MKPTKTSKKCDSDTTHMAKTIISGVRVQYARQLLQDLKKMRCLVKDNKIG